MKKSPPVQSGPGGPDAQVLENQIKDLQAKLSEYEDY